MATIVAGAAIKRNTMNAEAAGMSGKVRAPYDFRPGKCPKLTGERNMQVVPDASPMSGELLHAAADSFDIGEPSSTPGEPAPARVAEHRIERDRRASLMYEESKVTSLAEKAAEQDKLV